MTTTILRAAIIIGSGSASYEIIENLVRNCPILPTPPWTKTKCQPVAIRDVIKYLVGVLETPETAGGVFDIGGMDVLTYEDMLKIMAEVLGLKRTFVPVPSLSTAIYAYMASLITPVPMHICRCLMECTRNEVVCLNDEIRRLVPFKVLDYREAILRALSREEQDRVHTRWSDAYPPAHELAIKLHELEELPDLHELLFAANRKKRCFTLSFRLQDWRQRGMVPQQSAVEDTRCNGSGAHGCRNFTGAKKRYKPWGSTM